jgi:hypothetical protein
VGEKEMKENFLLNLLVTLVAALIGGCAGSQLALWLLSKGV